MADGDPLSVDGVVGLGLVGIVNEVSTDLVAPKVKVDPAVGGAADAATEEAFVKLAGLGEVFDRKGEVEWRHGEWLLINFFWLRHRNGAVSSY